MRPHEDPAELDRYRTDKSRMALLHQDVVTDLFHHLLHWPMAVYSSRAFQVAVGEGPSGVEIKHDDKSGGTGNDFIETCEIPEGGRSGDETRLVSSGIFRPDNSWVYAIGDFDTIRVYLKERLQRHLRERGYEIIWNTRRRGKGFLLPHAVGRELAMWVFTPDLTRVIGGPIRDEPGIAERLHRAILALPPFGSAPPGLEPLQIEDDETEVVGWTRRNG